jgi:hypothetical protein
VSAAEITALDVTGGADDESTLLVRLLEEIECSLDILRDQVSADADNPVYTMLSILTRKAKVATRLAEEAQR